MTTEITPSAGLFSGFADKENGWGAQVNANWLTLELLSVPIVTSAVVSNPPASPNSGDRYIIPANATGSWLGKDNQIALYMRGTWFYFPAKKGWLFHSLNESKTYQFSGAVWSQFFESLSSDTMQKINAAIDAGQTATEAALQASASKNDAVAAKSGAEAARDSSVQAATLSTTNKNESKTARDEAVQAKTDAVSARDSASSSERVAVYAAQTIQDAADSASLNAAAAQSARDTTVAAKLETLSARDSANASAGVATTQAGIATTQANISTTKAAESLSSANAAAAAAMQLPDYAALRDYNGTLLAVYITGYSSGSAPSGTAGYFTLDSTDTTSTDNGGTIIVDILNRRWKRQFSGAVNVCWFGADTTGVIVSKQSILKAHQTGNKVFYPAGIYNLGNLQQVGDVTDVAVDFTGLGSIHMDTSPGVIFKTNMTSAGITIAFLFDGNSHSTIGDCRFEGAGYDPTKTWQGTTAFALQGGNWGNITFGTIYCKNMVSPLIVSGGSDTSRIRGIRVKSLFLDDCYYGYNGSNNGDDVLIDHIYIYQGYRALFAYGCTGVVALDVNIRNPRSTTGTVCIASYPGFPTKGVRVNVRSWDVNISTTVNHVLFENFGPNFASAGITGCEVNYDITDSNSANPLIKIVTYDASGGSEISTPTAAQFHDNTIKGVAVGDPGLIICTAQYTSPQRNSIEGSAVERLDWTAFMRLQWSSIRTFSPAWTADGGTFPDIGNGTLVGEFYIENKRVYVNIVLVIGSTTTLGSGAWYFKTPYQITTKSTLTAVVGTGRVLRSGVGFKMVSVTQGAGADVVQLTAHDGGTQIGPTIPHAWVAGDNVLFSYSFPI